MELQEVIECLEELDNDVSVPKNVKQKILDILDELKSDKDTSLKVNKSLSELDEICEDSNLQPFVRTQLWNLTTLLESI